MSKKGFTLIEILIVVAIIAILSSVVIIGLGPAQRAGRDARRVADLRQVQNALELYFQRCGYYPGPPLPGGTCPNFTPLTGGSPTSNYSTMRDNILASNLGVLGIPAGDPAGRPYLYGVSANGQGYVLGATLDDRASSLLSEDLDGTIHGVNCGAGSPESPPVYCIGV